MRLGWYEGRSLKYGMPALDRTCYLEVFQRLRQLGPGFGVTQIGWGYKRYLRGEVS
jgi:hypothetical protein